MSLTDKQKVCFVINNNAATATLSANAVASYKSLRGITSSYSFSYDLGTGETLTLADASAVTAFYEDFAGELISYCDTNGIEAVFVSLGCPRYIYSVPSSATATIYAFIYAAHYNYPGHPGLTWGWRYVIDFSEAERFGAEYGWNSFFSPTVYSLDCITSPTTAALYPVLYYPRTSRFVGRLGVPLADPTSESITRLESIVSNCISAEASNSKTVIVGLHDRFTPGTSDGRYVCGANGYYAQKYISDKVSEVTHKYYKRTYWSEWPTPYGSELGTIADVEYGLISPVVDGHIFLGTALMNTEEAWYNSFNFLPGSVVFEGTSFNPVGINAARNSDLDCSVGTILEPLASGAVNISIAADMLAKGYALCELARVCAGYSFVECFGDPLYAPFASNYATYGGECTVPEGYDMAELHVSATAVGGGSGSSGSPLTLSEYNAIYTAIDSGTTVYFHGYFDISCVGGSQESYAFLLGSSGVMLDGSDAIFDYVGTTTRQYGIVISGGVVNGAVIGCTIQNLNTTGAFSVIYAANNNTSLQVLRNTITNCSGSNASGCHGINLRDGTSAIIEGNNISGLTNAGGALYAVYAEGTCTGSAVINNDISNYVGTGVNSSGVYTNASSNNFKVINNRIDRSTQDNGYGIRLSGSGTGSNIEVIGNVVTGTYTSGTSYGIRVASASAKVMANRITSFKYGLAIPATSGLNITASGNVILNAGAIGIYIAHTGTEVCNVINNTVVGGCSTSGIDQASATNSGASLIAQNIVSGCTGNGILYAGSAIVSSKNIAYGCATNFSGTPGGGSTGDSEENPVLGSNYSLGSGSPARGVGTWIAGVRAYDDLPLPLHPDLGAIQDRTAPGRRFGAGGGTL